MYKRDINVQSGGSTAKLVTCLLDLISLFPDRFIILIIVILQEFVAGLSLILRGSIYDRLNWAFNFYDLDKDGFITREVLEMKL